MQEWQICTGNEDTSIVMATHGTLQNIPIHKKAWTVYVKCLEQYLMTNKIEDADQQRAVLLSVCDPATYRLIRNLVSLKKSTQLTQVCRNHRNHAEAL